MIAVLYVMLYQLRGGRQKVKQFYYNYKYQLNSILYCTLL